VLLALLFVFIIVGNQFMIRARVGVGSGSTELCWEMEPNDSGIIMRKCDPEKPKQWFTVGTFVPGNIYRNSNRDFMWILCGQVLASMPQISPFQMGRALCMHPDKRKPCVNSKPLPPTLVWTLPVSPPTLVLQSLVSRRILNVNLSLI
jgi:hypothetical protein